MKKLHIRSRMSPIRPSTTNCSHLQILEKIFYYLSNIQDLLAVRLVCVQWAILGSKMMRTRHRPIIPVNIVGMYEDKVQFRIHDILKIKDSSLTFPSLKDHFPFNRFKFGEYALDMGVPYINKFFHLFSPISHVTFSPETLNNTQVSTFREIILFHLPQCESIELIFPRYGYLEFPWLFPKTIFTLLNPVLPNVIQLVLKLPTDRTEFVPQFFKDLFRAVPNVVTLKIIGAHAGLLDCLLSKDILQETYPFLKMQNLEIQVSDENRTEINHKNLAELTEISKKYLKLRTLMLSSMTDNVNLRAQQEFLAAVGGTLEKLTISKFSYFESLIPLGTIGINLKYFETTFLSEIQPLDFVFESLPNLKTLILGKVTSDLFSLKNLVPKLLVDAYPVHPLQKLTLPKGLIDSSALPKILEGFSKLRSLELTADDETLKSIYKAGNADKLKHFTELSLFDDSVVTDEGITGLPLAICRELYKNQCELPNGINSVEELRKDAPWIAYLTGLRVFQLTESDEKSVPKNRISNVSIIFGFRFLPELNNLTIPKTWITNFSLYYIGKYYTSPVVLLDISLCYRLTPPGIEKLKEDLPNLQIKCKNWYKNLVSISNRNENMVVPSSCYFMAF
ncbi:uncharacterized protein LOC110852082 isoform X2 [Folsomia candida]|uniref:uncharacterized protein LOC110852082 isoform X2 n=1 Tax=Folsomia candida TaxID=158441 RepID=UPI001604AF3D|nr:uncharacterized protein LOC110852082 isoform X2 [Folsomia candida]